MALDGIRDNASFKSFAYAPPKKTIARPVEHRKPGIGDQNRALGTSLDRVLVAYNAANIICPIQKGVLTAKRREQFFWVVWFD